jgi:hypothetical protein
VKELIGHSVRVNDIGLLQFMFPDFMVTDKPLLFTDRPIIFTGETKYINQIKELGVPFIIVNKLAEINLTDRLTLLEVIFSKYNKTPPKYLVASEDGKPLYERIEEPDFIDAVKMYWVTGKWNIKELDDIGKFVLLIDSFKTNTLEVTRTYLNMLQEVSSEYVETCLLSFISKLVNPGGSMSNWYKRRIKEFSAAKIQLLPQAMNNYINSPVENNELKIFNLIYDINKKR